jgi:carbon monoxide dehydrogenase subunit G
VTRARLTSSVLVARPPAAVWDYLVDWRRQGEWMPLTAVAPLDDEGHRVGGRLSARTGLGRLGFTDPMTITTWDPPYRLGLRHTGRVVRGEGTALVEAAGTGTRLTWEELIDVPGGAAGALAWRVARPLTQRVLDWTLDRLRRRLETGVGAGP